MPLSRACVLRESVRTGLLSTLIGSVWAWPAHAQTEPPATPPADSGKAADASQLDSVVVTGEKRSTSLQKTPISITAVTGAQLEKQGISDVTRLAAQIPGVSMESEGPGRTNFNIRGLSNSGGSSPTVGFYLNDVPVTPPSSPLSAAGKTEIDPDLYDLERVEVLRGPQGTLYGSSSMGGTIRLITNKPDLEGFDASTLTGVSSTRGGGINYTANAMVNVPLIPDRLALRVVLTDKYEAGFIDRVVLNPFPLPQANGTRGDVAGAPVQKVYKNDNSDRVKVARMSLLYQPTADLSITPSLFVQRLSTGMLSAYDSPPNTLAHYQPFDSPEHSSQNFDLYGLDVKYKFGNLILESSTSFLNESALTSEDDAESLFVAFGPAPTSYPSNNVAQESHRSRQYNEELRLSSNDKSSPVQWVTGVFFSSFSDTTGYNITSPDYGPIYGTSNVFGYNEPDKISQGALFGEVNDQFSPEWKLTAGLRYYSYRVSYSQTSTGLAAGVPFSSGSSDASGVTPKLTLTYTPTDNLLTYGTLSKGFRPGGPNTPIPVGNGAPVDCTSALNSVGLAAEPAAFKADTVLNYELGQKLRLLDGRVTVNGSLYYMDWNNIQQQVTLACGYNFSANSGKAVSKGGELEINAKITPNLLLQQSVGYTRAYLTRVDVPGNSPLGQQLPDVPHWTYATTVNYSMALSDDYQFNGFLSERFVGAEYNYTGVPAPFTQKPGYHVLDARVAVGPERWTTSLFVNNLFNERGIVGVQRSEAVNITEVARLIPIRPRTLGVELKVNF